MIEFGIALRKAREAKGLSQEQAAERTKMAVRTLSRLETGEGNPSLSTLLALANVYGLSLDALTGRPAFAKSQVAEKLATQARVQEHWIEAARLLSAIAQASPLRRLIALYILSKDESYIQELRTLAGSAPIVQFLKKIP